MAMVFSPDMTAEQYQAEIQRLQAEIARRKGGPRPSLKVSEKGGVSVYGLGRWPVTLYDGQWQKLLDMAGDIRAFIVENKALLKEKEA